MFNITEQELDSIAAASPQTELALFGVAFGAFVAFLTVLLTVQLGAYLMAIFVALTVTSFALSLFFGVAACKAMSAIRANLQNIKNRRM